MKQHLLTLLLALAASVAPLFAQSGTCGDNLTWTLDTESGTLTISGTGAMTNYSYDSYNYNRAPWYSYRESIKTVIIEDGVTSIGKWAFYDCKSLTSVTIPNSVTSIGISAFEGCSSLTSVTIPNSVTSIGSYAFLGCSSLISVTIPNSVTSIGYAAFRNCSSLTSVTIPNSVTSIGEWAFYNCSSLTSITVNSNSVMNLYLSPDGNLKQVFGEQVQQYIIGESVTSIGEWAFSGCSNLTSVTIGENVTSIGGAAFKGCSSLTFIDIPSSVTRIGSYAFEGCSMTSIVIPNSVTRIGQSIFTKCNNLISIIVESGNKQYDSRNNCNAIIETATDTLIAGCQETKIPYGVTGISYGAFDGCSNLIAITIPNSVTSIGGMAFSDCGKLTSVIIPNSVTNIGHGAFEACSSLSSIDIPNSVTNIGLYAFRGCSSLISFNIPDNVTSIGDETFRGCSSLSSIEIPYSVTSIGDWAFRGCSSLTSVTIPNSVTSIGSSAFEGCSSLTSVTIPNSVTSIGVEAFAYCTGLTSVTIGNRVTSIAQGAFYGCSSLKNVSIASSVKVLEESAFYNCTNIETITCYGMRPPTVNTNALYGLSYSTIVYVPADYLETYQMHEQWGLYDVRALENSGTEPATYTITWQDEDGNVIKTDQVAQDATPAFTGTTPTKEGYTFAGWLPNIKPATEDTKYTTYFIPTQQQESKVYTVNINGENCSLNINNQYPEGTVITLEAVADECFEFRQWSDGNKDNPRTVTVTKDMSLTAEFNKVRYTVTGQPSTGGKVQISKQ